MTIIIVECMNTIIKDIRKMPIVLLIDHIHEGSNNGFMTNIS